MMNYPSIDMAATGSRIVSLRRERSLSVSQMQRFFGFEHPQAIYKWQRGECLPSIDNLYAMSRLFGVSMNDILVASDQDVVVFSVCRKTYLKRTTSDRSPLSQCLRHCQLSQRESQVS